MVLNNDYFTFMAKQRIFTSWFENEEQDYIDDILLPEEAFDSDIFRNASTVDETPFSFEESSFHLEQLLGQRSPRTSLEDRNIIKDDNVAPILQATSEVLRKRLIQENLEHRLERRRSKEDLISANIIKEEMKGSVASSLQPAQVKLKFRRTQKELSQKLDHRPNVSQLVVVNIMNADVSPNLQATKRSLQFQTTSIAMDHKLEHRPSVSALMDHNILKPRVLDVAPNLHATQQQLKFHITACALDHKLENRRLPGELVESHIMKEFTDVPLESVDVARSLMQKLERRPSAERLIDQNILTVV